MIYLMENPGLLEEYDEFLPDLPNEKRRKLIRTASLKTKSQGIQAFLLLRLALYREYGLTELPSWNLLPMGKPYFGEKPWICFNISHCEQGILCAVSRKEVGADIQGTIQWKERLARRILSSKEWEIAWAEQEKLTLFWTLKESFLKYLGTGIRSDLRELDLSEWAFGKREDGERYLWSVMTEDYAASVFSEEPLTMQKVTWDEVIKCWKFCHF